MIARNNTKIDHKQTNKQTNKKAKKQKKHIHCQSQYSSKLNNINLWE